MNANETSAPVPPDQPTDLAKMVEAAAEELWTNDYMQGAQDAYAVKARLRAILLRHLQPLAEQHAVDIKRLTDQLAHEHNFDVANDAFSKELPPWPKSGEPTPDEAFAYFKKRALEPSDSAIRLAKFIPLDHQFQTIMNPVMLALVKWLDGKEAALTAAQEELAKTRLQRDDFKRDLDFQINLAEQRYKAAVDTADLLVKETKARCKLEQDLSALQSSAQKGAEDGKRLEREKWDMDALHDLYHDGGAPLVDFIVDYMLNEFNKQLGGKGWDAYESDGGLDDAIGYNVHTLLVKNQAIYDWDNRPLGPLLYDLVRLSDKESKQGKFRVTLDYDNYQDGGRVLDGDEKVIGECYDDRAGNADEDGPNSQLISAIIDAIDAAPAVVPAPSNAKNLTP